MFTEHLLTATYFAIGVSSFSSINWMPQPSLSTSLGVGGTKA